MAGTARKSDVEFFAAYADTHLDRWQQVIGRRVGHEELGTGSVQAVYQEQDYIVVEVSFSGTVRRFDTRLFNNRNFYELQLPRELRVQEVRIQLEEQIRREAAQRKEALRLLEIEEDRKQHEKLRLELEQRKREAPARTRFRKLRLHYLADTRENSSGGNTDDSPANPLYQILQEIDAGKLLSSEQLAWLEQGKFVGTLAKYYEMVFERTADPWSLVRARRL